MREAQCDHTPEAKAKCRTCQEDMKLGAKKCTKCDSYQDWRRFLSMSSSVLALLIALLSVTSVAGPSIIRMARGERSQIAVAAVQVSSARSLRLFVSNRGTRPAALGNVVLSISGTARLDTVAISLEPKAGSSTTIAAGSAVMLTFDTGLPGVAHEDIVRFLNGARPDDVAATSVLTVQTYDFGETRPGTTDVALPAFESRHLALLVGAACFKLNETSTPCETIVAVTRPHGSASS